jgi:hypothetical protein
MKILSKKETKEIVEVSRVKTDDDHITITYSDGTTEIKLI